MYSWGLISCLIWVERIDGRVVVMRKIKLGSLLTGKGTKDEYFLGLG